MNINVYQSYKVKCKSCSSDIDYLGDFKESKGEWLKVLPGGELMRLLARLLYEGDTDSFEFRDNIIYIDKFTPWTGEVGQVMIIFEEERRKENEN